jgi:hypothetical protein
VPSEPTSLPAPANAGPPGRRRMPGWLWPSLGGLAVAATALLFVAPMATSTMDAPSASSAPARIAGNGDATSTAAPMAAAEAPLEETEHKERAADMKPTAPMGGASAPMDQGLAAGRAAPAKDAASPATRSQLEALGYLDGTVAAGPAASAGTTRRDNTSHAASGAGDLALEGTGSTGDAAGADFAYGTRVSADKRVGTGGLLGGAEFESAELAESDALDTPPTDDVFADATVPAVVAPAPAAAARPEREAEPSADPAPVSQAPLRERPPRGRGADMETEEEGRGADRDDRDYADDDLSEDLDDEAAATGAAVTETVSRGGGGGFLRKSAPKARKAKRAEAPASTAPASEAPPPPRARNDADGDLAELRAAAWPLSAAPSTRGRAPAGWAAVDAARASGDTAALESALDALMRGPDDAVAQEAAWELARHHLQRGRRDLALVSIARGLERPGGHPISRARLLALQGEVLEQRGDPAGAKESYKRAVRSR